MALLGALAAAGCNANSELPEWIDVWPDGYDPSDVGGIENEIYSPFAREEILDDLRTVAANSELVRNRACECGLVSGADDCAAYVGFAACGVPFDHECVRARAAAFTDRDFALLDDLADALTNVFICTVDWDPGEHCNWIRDCFEPFTERMRATCPLHSPTLVDTLAECRL